MSWITSQSLINNVRSHWRSSHATWSRRLNCAAAWSKHGQVSESRWRPRYVQDQHERLHKPRQRESLLTREDAVQLGVSVFAERGRSHMDDVDRWCRLQICPPPSTTHPRLTADVRGRSRSSQAVHGAVSMLLWTFLCLKHQQKRLLVSLTSAAAQLCVLLPASPLRSQIAHFPFSTTCCDKSDVTSETDPWAHGENPGSVPCSGDRTSWSPREGKGPRVCVAATAVRLCAQPTVNMLFYVCSKLGGTVSTVINWIPSSETTAVQPNRVLLLISKSTWSMEPAASGTAGRRRRREVPLHSAAPW